MNTIIISFIKIHSHVEKEIFANIGQKKIKYSQMIYATGGRV